MQRSKDENPEERRERKRLVKEARVSARLQAISVCRLRLCIHHACCRQEPANNAVSHAQREARVRKKETKIIYKESASIIKADPMYKQRVIVA